MNFLFIITCSQEIKAILFELSRINEDFPIYDLAQIIADYVYETPTKCVQTLSGHTGGITSLIELKNGSLASGSRDRTIKIWGKKQGSINDWQCIQTLSGHDDEILSLIELKDGSLTSGSSDGMIKIWDKNASIFGKQQGGINEKSGNFSNNRQCVQTLSGHYYDVSSIIQLKDGSLASGSWDSTIKIWEKKQVGSDNRQYVQTLSGHYDAITSLIELKDGSLASGSKDGMIKIWGKNASIFGKQQVGINEKSGDFSNDWICAQTFSGHTDGITSLIELKNGSLASGSYDCTIKIFEDGKCVQTLSEHTCEILSLIELKDGSIASGSSDHTIKIWGKNASIFGKQQVGINEKSGDFSNDWQYVQTLLGHTEAILSFVELADGLLASGSDDHTIKIWA